MLVTENEVQAGLDGRDGGCGVSCADEDGVEDYYQHLEH